MSSPFISGVVAASALTGSFVNLLTATGPVRTLVISSDSDVAFNVSLGDDTNPLRLPANGSLVLDFGADQIQPCTTVALKHDGVAGNAARKISALLIQEPR